MQNAFNWADKLRRSNSESLEEYKLRNLVFSALIQQMFNRELSAPFNNFPGFQRLEDLKQFFVNN